MRYLLPRLNLDTVLTADGVVGGPIYLCRYRGCERYRRECGQTPYRTGGPNVYCEYEPARRDARRVALKVLREARS